MRIVVDVEDVARIPCSGLGAVDRDQDCAVADGIRKEVRRRRFEAGRFESFGECPLALRTGPPGQYIGQGSAGRHRDRREAHPAVARTRASVLARGTRYTISDKHADVGARVPGCHEVRDGVVRIREAFEYPTTIAIMAPFGSNQVVRPAIRVPPEMGASRDMRDRC